MHAATWTVSTWFLILALGCGPGDSSPPEPASTGGRQPAADGPVPAATPPSGGATPAGTTAADEPRPVDRRGGRGRCSRSPGAPDWEIRQGARAYREDGDRLGELPESVRIRCAVPTVAGGRGCFDAAEIGGLETDATRACFDEADVVEIYRQEGRRLPPPRRVTVDQPVVEGPFPADEIRRLVAAQQEPLSWCVTQQLAPGIDLDDRVEVSFVVEPRNSRVQDVKVRASALSPETRECVARGFESLRIPVVGEGRDTRVRALVRVETFVTEARREASR
jgi:hypothetical protein